MRSTNAIGNLVILVFFFGSIYIMYNQGNMAFFFGETSVTNAKIDSIKAIPGMTGEGWNQKVYYNYMLNNKNYNSHFINTAIRWEKPIKMKDSLQIKLSSSNPKNNKVIGVYYAH